MGGSRPIFAEDENGELVAMAPAAPPDEDELQGLIERHPEIVAEEDGELLFLAREQGVGDGEAASRWSLDHLFVTRAAVPVLLEVKRASDTRIRREVVGQILDYAANGTAWWPAGTLEAAFRAECARQGADPEERLAGFVGEDEAGGFWARVEANLADGRLRLVIAADVIPPELARVIEFLNDQMRADVRGVELRYFRSAGGRRTLVPRIVGVTERAKAAKGERRGQGARAASLEEWVTLLRAEQDEAVAMAAGRLADILSRIGADMRPRQDSLVAWLRSPGGREVRLLKADWRGNLLFVPASLRQAPGFAGSDLSRTFVARLVSAVGPLEGSLAEPRLALGRVTDAGWSALGVLFGEVAAMVREERGR